jgi:hypothetical protein
MGPLEGKSKAPKNGIVGEEKRKEEGETGRH